jgi:hypothetical protein
MAHRLVRNVKGRCPSTTCSEAVIPKPMDFSSAGRCASDLDTPNRAAALIAMIDLHVGRAACCYRDGVFSVIEATDFLLGIT